MRCKSWFVCGWAWLPAVLLACVPVAAADITVRDIAGRLHLATRDAPIDLARHDLAGLDLAGLDFKAARLAGADLTGTDLTAANFAGADLTGAKLDRSTLIRADFTRARMAGSALIMPAISTDFDLNPKEAPDFSGADLSKARVLVRLQGARFKGANFSHAKLGPHESARFNYKMLRTTLSGCDLSGANFSGADLTGVLFEFADLSGTNFTGADLSKADFTNANLTGADLTGANIEDAIFTGATLDRVSGLAVNTAR
jgi:uncharacterized protein YjbI with pentapeptide repeats